MYLSPPQTLQDSGYASHTEKRRSEGEMDNGDKENASPNKNKVHFNDLLVFLIVAHHGFLLQGARKALGPRWSTPASLPNMMFGGGGGDQSMLNPETPSKSLLGTDTSSSMLFSPPSILKVQSFLLDNLSWVVVTSVGVNDCGGEYIVSWTRVLMTRVGRYCNIDEGVNECGGIILYHG